MTPELFKIMVIAAIKSAFHSRAEYFESNPSTDNFRYLEESMYAHQFAKQQKAEELMALLEGVGMGQYESFLCRHVLSKNQKRVLDSLENKAAERQAKREG